MLTLALIQLNVGPDPAANLPTTLALMENAADRGATLIVTPECSNFLCAEGTSPRPRAVPQDADALLKAACALAAARRVWICLGSLILAQPDRPKLLNRQILIDPLGQIVTTYDKIHLFDVQLEGGEGYRESRTYDGGAETRVSQIEGHGFGHSICYDLRFPELFRGLDAEALLIPAAFTRTTGTAHWHTLLRARAIENGAFVIAPAQTGTHDGTRQTFGHSLAIDPWGEVLVDLGQDPGVGLVQIDWTQVTRRRAQIPAMTQGRLARDRLTRES